MSIADFIPSEFIELFSNPNFKEALKGYSLYLMKEDPEYRAEFKVQSLNLIKEDPEYRAEINTIIDENLDISFDNRLITSELKPIKRISNAENVLGLNDFAEEDAPTIPEQITVLAEKIDKIESNSQVCQPKNIIPETKTEVRAVFIKEYLDNKAKNNDNELLFLNNNEIKDLITHIIPKEKPECGVKKGQNIRKIKKDVIDKLAQIFPKSISINKNKNGRHETRVLFKPSLTVT
jgi:hypothetical protein